MNTKIRTIGVRLLMAFALVVPLALAGAQTVRAMEVDHDGHVAADEIVNDDLILTEEVVEMAGTVNGNLIAMGSAVTISGTVNGDVIAGGATVTVTGTVNGNLFVMGGDIIVGGKVENSLFFAGNEMTLGPDASVKSNMYAAGFSISLQAGSTVGRDIAAAGYQVVLHGEIGRDVLASVGAFELEGKVGRNVTVEVGGPDEDAEDAAFLSTIPFTHTARIILPGLHVSSQAVIGGKLEYTSAVEQSAGIQTTPEGGVTYIYRPSADTKDLKNIKPNVTVRMFDVGGMVIGYMFGVIREFLTLVLLGALAVWLLPSVLTRAAGTLRTNPLPSLGWGSLLTVGGFAVLGVASVSILMLGIAICVVTLFGLSSIVFGIGFSAIGLAGSVFMALVLFGSKLVVALLIGDWFLRLFRKDYSASSFWPLLLGILLIVFLDAVPGLGILFNILVIVFGFGAIWLVFRDWLRTRNQKA